MKQKFTLSDLKRNINESINNDSSEQSNIVLKYGGNVFNIKLSPNLYKNKYKQYLSNVVSNYTKRKLKPATQESYLNKLEIFMREELEPLGIAKKFNIYRVDSIEALEFLLEMMNDSKNPLYKINKNDYRKVKNGRTNPYCDRKICNYLGGDPSASLAYYIKFLKENLE